MNEMIDDARKLRRLPRNIRQFGFTTVFVIVLITLLISIHFFHHNDIVLNIIIGILSGFVVYLFTFYMDVIRDRRRNLEKLLIIATEFSNLIGSLNHRNYIYQDNFIQVIEKKMDEFSEIVSIFGELWFVDEKEMVLLFNNVYSPIDDFICVREVLMYHELKGGNSTVYSSVINDWKSGIFDQNGNNIIKKELDDSINHFLKFCEDSKI